MPKTLDSAFTSAIASGVIRPVYALEMELASSTIRYCTAGRDLTFNSQTYSGNGYIHGIGSIESVTPFDGTSIEVVLTGAVSALITLVQGSFERSKPARIDLLLMAANGTIASSDTWFLGTYQGSEIDIGPDGARLIITYEDIFSNREEDPEFRYSNEYQQSKYPGDLFCEYVAQLNEVDFYFGRPEKPKKAKSDGRGKGGKPRRDPSKPPRDKKKKRRKRRAKNR